MCPGRPRTDRLAAPDMLPVSAASSDAVASSGLVSVPSDAAPSMDPVNAASSDAVASDGLSVANEANPEIEPVRAPSRDATASDGLSVDNDAAPSILPASAPSRDAVIQGGNNLIPGQGKNKSFVFSNPGKYRILCGTYAVPYSGCRGVGKVGIIKCEYVCKIVLEMELSVCVWRGCAAEQVSQNPACPR